MPSMRAVGAAARRNGPAPREAARAGAAAVVMTGSIASVTSRTLVSSASMLDGRATATRYRVPSLPRARRRQSVASNASDSPAASVTSTSAPHSAAETMRSSESEIPAIVAVMRAWPSERPVATPRLLTDATAALLDVQVRV